MKCYFSELEVVVHDSVLLSMDYWGRNHILKVMNCVDRSWEPAKQRHTHLLGGGGGDESQVS